MDPVMMGAVLLAVVSGAGEGLGAELWKALLSLVRHPFHRKSPAGAGAMTVIPSGEAEATALQLAPTDQQRALALAKALLSRADVDAPFKHALEAWWKRAEPIRASSGNVTNTIGGGTQHGPILQGRDFSNISFGMSPPEPERP